MANHCEENRSEEAATVVASVQWEVQRNAREGGRDGGGGGGRKGGTQLDGAGQSDQRPTPTPAQHPSPVSRPAMC